MMRMYHKVAETNEKVIYEYLCSDYKRPYTGLIEIRKSDHETTVVKPADKEPNPRMAGFHVFYEFPKMNYPERFTHTGA